MALARRKRRRRRWRRQPGWALVAAILLGAVLYGVGGPLLYYWLHPDVSAYGRADEFLIEQTRLRSLQAFAVVWFFFLGGCIGSFLNVVIYRVPRGRTLMGNSGCPYCTHAIRFRHNIPVIGWLLLRGRCYDCRLPISPRYPLVETLVGAVFLLLAVVELFSGGRNLPVRQPTIYSGIEWVVFSPQWDLIQLYGLHCSLLCVLLSWALIWHDRQRVPLSYGLLAFTAAAVAIGWATHLAFVPWKAGFVISSNPHLEALFRAFCGFAVGAAAGALSWSLYPIEPAQVSRANLALRGVMCGGLAGLVVGWQGILSILVLMPAMRLLLRELLPELTSQSRDIWPLPFFAATWLHLCLWKALTQLPAWPSPTTHFYNAPVYVVFVSYLAAQVAYFTRPQPEDRAPSSDEAIVEHSETSGSGPV